MFNKKEVLILCFVLLLNVVFVSAVPPVTTVQQFPSGLTLEYPNIDYIQNSQDYMLHVHVFNSTGQGYVTNSSATCYAHLYNSTGNHLVEKQMGFDSNGYDFELLIDAGNFTNNGIYAYLIFCNTTGGAVGYTQKTFEVTNDGTRYEMADSIIQSLFILFFIGLLVGVYIIKSKVNLEKMKNGIYEKYQNKNYVKLVTASIGYNILNNSFILYYLISFPIIVLLTDLAFIYGFSNLTELLKAITIVYSVGVIIVGLIFLSYVQEWFIDLLEKIKNMEWGVE